MSLATGELEFATHDGRAVGARRFGVELVQFCDHLLIRDLRTGRLAGTYRLLGQEAARRAGGFYSETEFDLGAIRHLTGRVLAVGRAGVDPDYRSGG